MSTFYELASLSWREWRYLIQAAMLLPFIRLALRGWGFRRVYGLLLRAAPIRSDRSASFSDVEIASLVRMVDVAASHGIVRAHCLPRSLAAWWMLRRQGVASEIRIGVNQQENVFQAHAWVERNGVILNDSDDMHQRFAAFEGPIAPTSWEI